MSIYEISYISGRDKTRALLSPCLAVRRTGKLMGGLGGCSQASCMISPAPRSDYSQFTFSPLDKQKQPVLPRFQCQMFLFLPPLLSIASATWNLPQLASSLRLRRAPSVLPLSPHTPGCAICTRLRLTLHGKNESAGKFLFFSHSAVVPSLFCFPSAATAGSLFYTRSNTREHSCTHQVFICLLATSAPCLWKPLYRTASADVSLINWRKGQCRNCGVF